MIQENINQIPLQFVTDSGLFSPESLDKGTLAMLSQVHLTPQDKVLDLGCGYGTVGIYVAKIIGDDRVIMSDVSQQAIACARENIILNQVPGIPIVQSDGFSQLADKDFTLILSNPPYHTDFSVAKHFIEKGFNRLATGGRMYMVTKRKDWYKNKFIALFGGVKIKEIDGYFIFMAEKKQSNYKNAVPKNKQQ